MAMKFVGSLCLSDIPKKEIKVIKCKDGVDRFFLNISVHENAEPRTDGSGKLISDHFISCAPRKEERDTKTNYIIGNLRTWEQQAGNAMPTAEEINNAPSYEEAGVTSDLPF